MKYLPILLLLATFICCKETSKPKLFVQDLDSNSGNRQTEISENVLRYVKYRSKIIALTNVKVFDGTGSKPKEDQTIIVIDDFFRKIGKSSEISIPAEATVLNLNGKTIIPGIVGVHNHLHIPGFPFIGEAASKLYLASGVTTIQTCGSASPEKEIELVGQVKNGLVVGPNIYPSGPYFTGKGGNPNMIIPKNEEDIRNTIEYWTNKGVEWFKVYRNTEPDDLKIIIEEAHSNNAKVTGHLCSITFEQATSLGIDGIEHGFTSMSDFRENKIYGECSGSRKYLETLDIKSDKVKRLQRLMVDENVFMTSTLAIYESGMPDRAFADERSLKIMSPLLRAQYQEGRNNFNALQKATKPKNEP